MRGGNEILLTVGGYRTALDMDRDTRLFPTFQSNDRTSPSTIENDFSQEFSVPNTAHNAHLLGFAATSQGQEMTAYTRVPCILLSQGVETLPQALLYLKGFAGGRYKLQITGGNRRLVDALKHPDGTDKTLRDLDLSRFDHDWTPANILPALSFDYWQKNGWGYEPIERGRPLDLQNLNPYDLYPSCSGNLVWSQLLADAGFTADSLLGERLFAALNIPSANPFAFSSDFREARALKAGFEHAGAFIRFDEFQERAPFNFVTRKPFSAGKALDISAGVNQYVVPTLGYYDLDATANVYFGCLNLFGTVSMKMLLRVNGAALLNKDGSEVKAEDRFDGFKSLTFTAAKKRVLLKPGDVVDVLIQGDKWDGIGGVGPSSPTWYFGTRGPTSSPDRPIDSYVEPACSFSVTLTEEFPEGGRVKLNEWLPDLKQIDLVKSYMMAGGLTIQTDSYTPHLRLATGDKLLLNVAKALNWTTKRDAAHRPGRQPERDLDYRFGPYAQTNFLRWAEDEKVTAGYGDGTVLVQDAVLPREYEMGTFPFAATESSQRVPGLLRILNFDTEDELAKPVVYSKVSAKPRLVLREAEPTLSCQLITTPAVLDNDGNVSTPAVLTPFTTSASYFDGDPLSLVLDKTVLTTYWADLRSLLDRSRFLVERYRLSAADISRLDFSIPIWDSELNDYFAISKISQFDASRSVEVTLCRINARHLGPPRLPRGVGEFYTDEEFYQGEFY